MLIGLHARRPQPAGRSAAAEGDGRRGARRASVTEWDEFTGRIEAVNTVAIRPRVSGFVSAVRFEEGAIVRAGDLLFQIDPRPFQAEVDRLRAELARARATVQRAGSELSARSASPSRTRCRTRSRSAAPRSRRSRTRRSSAVEAALRAAELNLEFTRVTSPIAGRVGRAIVTEGNLVSSGPGEATLLTTVVSLDPIYASFDADEQTLLRYQDARARRQARQRAPVGAADSARARLRHGLSRAKAR